MKAIQELETKIRAGYPCVYLVSPEEDRAKRLLAEVTRKLAYKTEIWSIVGSDKDPHEVLSSFLTAPEKTILVLQDFHEYLKQDVPLVRRLKEALLHAKGCNKTVILLSSVYKLPADLDQLVTKITLPKPDNAELTRLAKGLLETLGLEVPADLAGIVESASGLTEMEAENAFALSLVQENKRICRAALAREKASCFKKTGLLEFLETSKGLADIGGLEDFKHHISLLRRAFTKEAKDYGLPTPRSQLLVGMPGTGKSLAAEACGSILEIPTLRLEASSLFASLVGESEANWRECFATAQAMSPCILWIDEADGLFGQSKSVSDSGVSQHLIKAILQDMQFRSEGILFFFTANDIDKFPDALIDRVDCWSVDLPVLHEREEIWKIQISKRARSPENFQVKDFAQHTEGFSGRQIEQIWLSAMTLAFNEGVEVKNEHVFLTLPRFIPTSITMADALAERRKRLVNKTRPASRPAEKLTRSVNI